MPAEWAFILFMLSAVHYFIMEWTMHFRWFIIKFWKMASETVTSDKPYSSTLSGITHPLCVQRKQRKWGRTSRACWWPFLTLGGDFLVELFLQSKQLITAGRICNIGGSKSACKCPVEWRNHDWLVHHDSLLVHTVLSVQHFFATKVMVVVSHPPYLRSLAPCDIILFLRMKSQL